MSTHCGLLWLIIFTLSFQSMKLLVIRYHCPTHRKRLICIKPQFLFVFCTCFRLHPFYWSRKQCLKQNKNLSSCHEYVFFKYMYSSWRIWCICFTDACGWVMRRVLSAFLWIFRTVHTDFTLLGISYRFCFPSDHLRKMSVHRPVRLFVCLVSCVREGWHVLQRSFYSRCSLS